MAYYRKLPVVIEAVQWLGFNWNEICDFMKIPENGNGKMEKGEMIVVIKTLEGNMEAKINDFIIKGVQGEFYPCKPTIFKETYIEVEDEKIKDV